MSKQILFACAVMLVFHNGFACAQHSPHKKSLRMCKIYLKASVAAAVYKKFKWTEDLYKKSRPHSHPTYSIGIGRIFSKSIRADLNLSYSAWQYKASSNTTVTYAKQKGSQTSLILNGYYNLNLHKKFVPYITAGAGLSRLNTGDFVFKTVSAYALKSKKLFSFTWNAGIGISYIFKKKYAVDAGYLYTDFGKTKTFGLPTQPATHQLLRTHALSIGLRALI